MRLHQHSLRGLASTPQTRRHLPSTFARTRQTRRHSPSGVARTRQTRRHSPSRVARTRQTCRHLPKAVFEKNVTRLAKFANLFFRILLKITYKFEQRNLGQNLRRKNVICCYFEYKNKYIGLKKVFVLITTAQKFLNWRSQF